MSGFKEMLGDVIYPDAPGHRGIDTSIAAAESMKSHVSQIARHIEEYLFARGDTGGTYSEIMRDLSLGAPTVSARLRELVLHGRIKSSEQRRPTPSRRMARVYVTKQRSAS